VLVSSFGSVSDRDVSILEELVFQLLISLRLLFFSVFFFMPIFLFFVERSFLLTIWAINREHALTWE
jgi:hypothetical protein